MDYGFLTDAPLFQGIREEELREMLGCLNARERAYRKGEVILRAGDCVTELGFVEQGSVNIVVNYYWGDSGIFGHVTALSVFAETYAAIPGKELLCDVVAAEDSRVLFLDMRRLTTTCAVGCAFHQRLVHNLLRIFAQKNYGLSARMMHTAPRSLRVRLLSYLSEQAAVNGSAHFTIPFDRQQLADYLGVDRSAMSNELSKMRRDGLISCRRNEFTLHAPAEGGTVPASP